MLLHDHRSRNQLIHSSGENAQGVELWMKREDEIDEEISGNKWRKLRYSLQFALENKKERLVSFGGAFSNHALAVAKAAHLAKLRCLLFIRGESEAVENATLSRAIAYGAELVFLDRAEYRLKQHSTSVNQRIRPSDHFVPEGGTDRFGVKGCMEILDKDDKSFDFIACCQGTGGTATGMLLSLRPSQLLLSFPALKGAFFADDIHRLLLAYGVGQIDEVLSRLRIYSDHHCGGYAKWTPDLIVFMRRFRQDTGIALDPIYTGKMMMGLYAQIEQGEFPEGSRILAIHTGGMQGVAGFQQRWGVAL